VQIFHSCSKEFCFIIHQRIKRSEFFSRPTIKASFFPTLRLFKCVLFLDLHWVPAEKTLKWLHTQVKGFFYRQDSQNLTNKIERIIVMHKSKGSPPKKLWPQNGELQPWQKKRFQSFQHLQKRLVRGYWATKLHLVKNSRILLLSLIAPGEKFFRWIYFQILRDKQ